jgi:hypothetical protein
MRSMQYSYNILVLKNGREIPLEKSWIGRKREIKSYFKPYVIQTWSHG